VQYTYICGVIGYWCERWTCDHQISQIRLAVVSLLCKDPFKSRRLNWILFLLNWTGSVQFSSLESRALTTLSKLFTHTYTHAHNGPLLSMQCKQYNLILSKGQRCCLTHFAQSSEMGTLLTKEFDARLANYWPFLVFLLSRTLALNPKRQIVPENGRLAVASPTPNSWIMV